MKPEADCNNGGSSHPNREGKMCLLVALLRVNDGATLSPFPLCMAYEGDNEVWVMDTPGNPAQIQTSVIPCTRSK
jgi:hypothetical protein